MIEGAEYGVTGGYYGRFRMVRLEVPPWGGPRQVLMERLDWDTGEVAGADPVPVRPQDVVAPWDEFLREREARQRTEEATQALGAQVRHELTARGIEWTLGEWRRGAHLISLSADDLAKLLGLGPASALEEILSS